MTTPVRGQTFRARLTGAVTLLCVCVLVAAGSSVYWNARQALRANLDDSLLKIARAEIAAAPPRPGAQVSLVLGAGGGYEKFAQVENSADEIVARTENLRQFSFLPPNPPLEAKARAGATLFGEMTLGGTPFRAVYYPFTDARQNRLLAVVAVSEEPMRHALHTLSESVLLSLLIGGGLSAFGANRLARRLTLPLTQIAAAARSVEGASLATRIPAFSPDAELLEMTAVLNDMLTRLEAAFAAQARFVADASHELRSPLSNLRGTVEVALRRPRTPEEYRQTLDVSLGEIERLSRLASDLLTLSQADMGRFPLSLRFCDLQAVAASAISAHRAQAEEKEIALEFKSTELLPVWGDPDRLRQVLDNLLDNALRHAPPGSVVSVEVRGDGEMGMVRVSDCGAGIDLDDQTRIFERFYRADSSRARHSGGVGLGLAIAKAIAEAHGGQIGVESRPGGGAAFTLRLPVKAADARMEQKTRG